MAGFSSISNLRSAVFDTAKTREYRFSKTSASTAAPNSGWYELFTGTGNPGAISFSGTAGVATQLTNTTSGALVPLDEGNVSTDKRYLLEASVYTGNTQFAPGIVIIADLLLYYPNCDVVTPTTLDNTTTLGRYTDGVGVMAIARIRSQVVNSAHVLTLAFTADDNSAQSGTLTFNENINNYEPANLWDKNGIFMSIPAGKLGCKKITSYTYSGTGVAGKLDLLLVKPLAVIPIPGQNVVFERDFIQPFLSAPQIQDGACLGLIMFHSATIADLSAVTIRGSIKYGWN